MERLPFPVLLSRVLGGITRHLEAAVDGPGASSLAVHSNVLRCVGDGTTDRRLATDARISKRLAIAAVTGARRVGWVTAGDGNGRRERDVALTEAGRTSVAAWEGVLREFEATAQAADLRAATTPIVASLPLELPWYPASYGTADPSVTGGAFVKRDGSVPPHGQDWRPVHRDRESGGDTTAGVPVTGLLSQLLVAFTIEYEARPMWPLSSTTLVVRHLRDEPILLDDVPGDHGITGNGKSLLERHMVCMVAPDADNPKCKLVQLTVRGRMIRAQHEPALQAVEHAFEARHGERFAELRSVLERHQAATDATLPDHVVAPLHLG